MNKCEKCGTDFDGDTASAAYVKCIRVIWCKECVKTAPIYLCCCVGEYHGNDLGSVCSYKGKITPYLDWSKNKMIKKISSLKRIMGYGAILQNGDSGYDLGPWSHTKWVVKNGAYESYVDEKVVYKYMRENGVDITVRKKNNDN